MGCIWVRVCVGLASLQPAQLQLLFNILHKQNVSLSSQTKLLKSRDSVANF